MPDVDSLKAEIKKLSAQAMKAKLDLHDLSEELPVNWLQIPEVAARAFEAFKLLASAKGADARRQTMEELVSSSGGALDAAPVLRVFLKSKREELKSL